MNVAAIIGGPGASSSSARMRPMVLMGTAMSTGERSARSYWLLETFSELATVG